MRLLREAQILYFVNLRHISYSYTNLIMSCLILFDHPFWKCTNLPPGISKHCFKNWHIRDKGTHWCGHRVPGIQIHLAAFLGAVPGWPAQSFQTWTESTLWCFALPFSRSSYLRRLSAWEDWKPHGALPLWYPRLMYWSRALQGLIHSNQWPGVVDLTDPNGDNSSESSSERLCPMRLQYHSHSAIEPP